MLYLCKPLEVLEAGFRVRLQRVDGLDSFVHTL